MIVNVQNNNGVITVDIRCHQIRYVKNIAKKGAILFYGMTQTETECYEYLYNNNQESFLKALAEDVSNNMQVKPIDATKLKILTQEEYLILCVAK